MAETEKELKANRTQWTRPHLLGIFGLSAGEIQTVLDHAFSFKEVSARRIKKVPTLRGRTVIQLFLEPSTRTRTSFELAAKRLSGDILSITSAGSSLSKGESLSDMAKNLQAMNPDIIVVRHPASGAPENFSKMVSCSVVNAGDGWNEHPTQALVDAMTIIEKKQRIKNLKVVIVGDILHSRVARSNIYALTTLGADVHVCGPGPMLPAGMDRMGVKVHLRLDEAVKDADVVMALRVQNEREAGMFIPNTREYARQFGLNRQRLKTAKPDVIIMHPGPVNRGVEISHELADGPNSVILDQVANGIAARMAVLYLVSTTHGDAEDEE